MFVLPPFLLIVSDHDSGREGMSAEVQGVSHEVPLVVAASGFVPKGESPVEYAAV